MTRSAQTPISKSTFVSGLQCHKRMWIERYARHLLPTRRTAEQDRLEQARQVGELARDLFPGGLEIGPRRGDWEDAAARTKEALLRRHPLYEAAFVHRDIACRVDILNPVDGGKWDVYEVRSSAGLKEGHLDDLAFQAHVVENAGLEVGSFHVIHFDSEYIRRGELDLPRLFVVEEVTEDVLARRAEVAGSVEAQRASLQLERAPEVDIGPQCDRPRVCPLKSHCWSFAGAGSVLELTEGKDRRFELLRAGITEMADIPNSVDLTPKQRVQVDTARSGRPHVELGAIETFLDSLDYPISFLDIETFASPIPLFGNTRPYQQIPFLFSVHRVAERGADARHFAYQTQPGSDPRPDFIRAVANTLGRHGSVIAYNAAFESRAILHAAREVPGLEAWASDLADRFVDLLEPFRSFDVYHPDQEGSASLERVLPAFTEISYDELDIRDGETAGQEFLRVSRPEADPVERAEVMREIEAYCSLDTLGMVALVEVLRTA